MYRPPGAGSFLVRFLVLAAAFSLPLVSRAENGCDKLPQTSKCICDDSIVNCTAGPHTASGDEIFTQIRGDDFDSLSTLILTGYQFRKLPKNLFGEGGKPHTRLSKIVLSSNNISEIHGQAFRQVPNLEYLDLSYNQIALDFRTQKMEERLFSDMPRLKTLYLRAALEELKHNMTFQILAWKSLFEHGLLSELTKLDLEGNGLSYVPMDLICRLPSLTHLFLGNNDITSFNAVKDCFKTLQHLDLSDNEIEYLNSSFIDLIEDAEHDPKVDLAGNPFTCDCYLKHFVHWFKKTDRITFPDQTFCYEPEYLRNHPLKSLDEDKLLCPTDGWGHIHGVYIVIALALIGLIVLFGCIIYFNRRCVCPDHRLKIHQLAGYAQLQKDEEAAAQPEFV